MLDAHFLKKKIQFERMKERMKERIIEEEDDSSDGEKEPDIKVENINDNKNKVSAEMMKLVNEATKNEVKEGTDEDVANDVKKMNETNLVTGAELNRNVNLKARDQAEINNEIEGITQKNHKSGDLLKINAGGIPFNGTAPDNDVTEDNPGPTRLRTAVGPKEDPSTIDNNNNNKPCNVEEIKYGLLSDIRGDKNLGDDRISGNGLIVTQLQKDKLLEDEVITRNKCDETGNNVINETMTSGFNSKFVQQKKAKVLEVRKGNRLEPIVRERSFEEPKKDLKEESNNQLRHKSSLDSKASVPNETYTTIKTVIEDPDNQVVCVVTSCPPQQTVKDRQTSLNSSLNRKRSFKRSPVLLFCLCQPLVKVRTVILMKKSRSLSSTM